MSLGRWKGPTIFVGPASGFGGVVRNDSAKLILSKFLSSAFSRVSSGIPVKIWIHLGKELGGVRSWMYWEYNTSPQIVGKLKRSEFTLKVIINYVISLTNSCLRALFHRWNERPRPEFLGLI